MSKNKLIINGKEIEISNETAKNLEEQFYKKEEKKGVTIYKKDGSVLYKTDCKTMKEAVEQNKANLYDANLCGANLREANLREADLREADLREADLCDANLRGANLYDANLCGADLCGADLCDADLCGADLNNAKFYGRGGTKKLKKEQVKDFLLALGFIIEE